MIKNAINTDLLPILAVGGITSAPTTIHLPGLMAFEAAARLLNFAKAAAELGVTPTAMSRTIKILEAQLSVRLFNRTTRSVGLTEAGIALNASIAPALASIRGALAQVSHGADRPSGLLRINLSYVAYRILVEPHIDAFFAAFPAINLEISLDNQLSDIVSAGFDAGIRLGRKVQNDMVAVQLGGLQQRVVLAAPDYFRERSRPERIEDLLGHDCIRQRYSFGGRLFDWKFQVAGQMVHIDVQGRLIVDDMHSVVDSAVRGAGIAFVYADFARQEIAAGSLVRILTDDGATDDAFHIYYPHRSQMPGKLRAFVDFMREANRPASLEQRGSKSGVRSSGTAAR
ncbi:LysR family transcriptional regulator [Pseudoduganella lutea]|uniref:LysR family transcriptional regulator n=1 Tax=Pseudoduganella lutea TaxID=321985 RepID=A0A4P6L538_9BURK|nr:LysR family transcriptional regulator [Pseudoduganella lutea]QBE66729.1 LysR family transcriptional regulator [Pseudoduganella lutea]